MTHTQSEAAAYEFTTLTVSPACVSSFQYSNDPDLFDQAIPGVLEYEGARIQLLDLPGIVEGASQGRGRGRQVVAGKSTRTVRSILKES